MTARAPEPVLDERSVLVTGGTGSFGRCFVATVLARYRPRRLVVFSRDELKQFEMAQAYGPARYPCMRYVIGDVRDRDALHRALEGIDVVVHAAALKHVPTAEANPLEAVKTNVLGTANLVDAALDRGVGRVLALSSDKAASPVNLYGATKLCADKLLVAANRDGGASRFSVVRYGNVLGSRGSVVPVFLARRAGGEVPITDPRMTRFWITLPQVVDFTLSCLERMQGGEVFVPKIPSMRLVDLARAVAPGCRMEVVGIRPGEKLHEVLIAPDDARQAVEYDDRYVILPPPGGPGGNGRSLRNGGRPCPEDFRYSSESNPRWLSVEELRAMVEALG